jgi:hypothetical protein
MYTRVHRNKLFEFLNYNNICSLTALSGPLSGEPKTNSSLFCLSVIYMQKSLKRWKKYWFADTENVPHIIMYTRVHRNKLFEFLNYNNICSLTALLNELISKLCREKHNTIK